MKMIKNIVAAIGAIALIASASAQETTLCKNPFFNGDLPDMSITRHGDDYYLVSTTMHLMPGAPVMHSKDLVHWHTVSYVFDSLTDTPSYSLNKGTVYGRGQWASSIRYNNGKYYMLFSPNDEPFKSYIYSTTDPTGKWELVSRLDHFHDASLFFDDDGRVYVFYATGMLRELKSDLSGVKQGGVDIKLFERDADENGLLEGSQVIKRDGKYYLLMISWPRNAPRNQVCYRADNITGPYEKKVILRDSFDGFGYVGQGCIVDDTKGNWYGLIFQDRAAIGRVPLLMPCTWVDGWPMLGDAQGRVPKVWNVPLKPQLWDSGLVERDGFDSSKLKMCWQWNHNPMNDYWSLTERSGYLRLKTNRVVENIFAAPNTISQRMTGPECSAVISLDVSKMKDGDVAGFAAFNGDTGMLSVKNEGGKKYVTMSTASVALDDKTKAITGVDYKEVERVKLNKKVVYFRIDGDFNLNRDIATFYYSLDNRKWTKLGDDFKMKFDYRRFFMGTRFAIFNYATKSGGGSVDVDSFNYYPGVGLWKKLNTYY